VPELLEGGAQKHLHSSSSSRKVREAWGTGGKTGDGLASHQDRVCSPQPCLLWFPSPMVAVATGGGYMPPNLGL
jgi:hypothetical protein